MNIAKERVQEVFQAYTNQYDATDEKIKLKIDHTYRVADICERIAKSLFLSQEDIKLAWLLGMLHDVGRFEQLRRYGTFSDAQSIDHAHFGAELLYETADDVMLGQIFPSNVRDSQIRDAIPLFLECFVDILPEEEAFSIIRTAIWNHSAFRVEEGLDDRTEMFCHLLRDADKVDIFKVCQDTPLEVIYNTTKETVLYADISEEVVKQFFEKHAILRNVRQTPIDHLVGHAALAFELVYPESLNIAKEQGYLQQIFHFPSKNPRTVEQFQKMEKFLEEYMLHA